MLTLQLRSWTRLDGFLSRLFLVCTWRQAYMAWSPSLLVIARSFTTPAVLKSTHLAKQIVPCIDSFEDDIFTKSLSGCPEVPAPPIYWSFKWFLVISAHIGRLALSRLGCALHCSDEYNVHCSVHSVVCAVQFQQCMSLQFSVYCVVKAWCVVMLSSDVLFYGCVGAVI